MSKYKLTNSGIILTDEGRKSIPMMDGNADFEEYKIFLAEGGTPDPADPELIVEPRLTVEDRLKAAEEKLELLTAELIAKEIVSAEKIAITTEVTK